MGVFEVRCLVALASSLRWVAQMERRGLRVSTMRMLRTATMSSTIRRPSIQAAILPSELSG
jgi:hypothetical protein